MKEFESTVLPEVPGLKALAVYLLPDRHLADEVVQKTLIRAHEQWADYRQDQAVGPWLRTILRYFVKGELKELQRSVQRRQRYHAEWLRETATECEGDPFENLHHCQGELAPASQRLIQLKYEQEQSCQQIADALDRSLSWVTTTLSRVRRTLKTCLEIKMKEGDDE